MKLVHNHVSGPNGRSAKCKQPFPCERVTVLSRVNYGFVLKAESLAGFSDEEMEWHLHPKRARDRDLFAAFDDEDVG